MSYINSKRFSGIQLYHKKNGDVTYYIRYKNLYGKLIREKIGDKSAGITEIYCNKKRNQILNKLRLGEDVETTYSRKHKTKFEEIWVYFANQKPMKEKRRDELRGVWKNYMKTYFENDVTVEKILKFRISMKEKLAARTIDMRVSELGTAFNYWNSIFNDNKFENPVPELRLYDRSHTSKQDIKARNIQRDRYLSNDDVKRLKSELIDKNEDIKLFVALSLSTGARIGSILTITKKDIRGRKVTIINHKTGGGKYLGFLNDEAYNYIQPKLASLNPNGTLFTMDIRQIQRGLKTTLDNLFNIGLDTRDTANRVVLHTFRHTFASRLVENGVPIVKVQKLLDHKDINTTMRYSHLAPDSGLDDVLSMWN